MPFVGNNKNTDKSSTKSLTWNPQIYLDKNARDALEKAYYDPDSASSVKAMAVAKKLEKAAKNNKNKTNSSKSSSSATDSAIVAAAKAGAMAGALAAQKVQESPATENDLPAGFDSLPIEVQKMILDSMAEASQTKEKSKYSPDIYKESVNPRGVITPAAAIPDKYLPGVSGVGTDSGTGVYSELRNNMSFKGITSDDYNLLKEYYGGDEAKARDAVLNYSENILKGLIEEKKRNEGIDENGFSNYISEVYNKTKTFMSDKWASYMDWRQGNTEKLNTFITQNTDQLNVNTETFQTVKRVYKYYRDKGIDINQFDVEKYKAAYGRDEFNDKFKKSTMVDADMYPNGVFLTEKDANIAYAQKANPITIADDRETGTIIVKVPVTMRDKNGEKYVLNMYTTDDIFEGMQGNIITGTAARIAAYTMDPTNPIPISVTHAHPESGMDDTFSRGIIGDELVARWPGVKNMYVSDVETGNLLVFNEAKPSTLFKRQDEIDYEDEGYNFKLAGNLPKINP